jgi:spore coat protein A, manganese oxidase
VRVIAKFDGWRGKYVFHCHNLEHEDMMMADFEVV